MSVVGNFGCVECKGISFEGSSDGSDISIESYLALQYTLIFYVPW